MSDLLPDVSQLHGIYAKHLDDAIEQRSGEGEGRISRTPAERAALRESRAATHVPEHSEEWDRLRDVHGFNPLSYGMEAASRLDRAAGAASQGENNIYDPVKAARGVAELATPNHELGDKYGMPGRFADAVTTTANMIPGMEGSQKLLSGAVGPIVRGAMHTPDVLNRMFRLPGDDYSGYAEGGKIIERLGPKFAKWFGNSKVVDAAGDPLRVYHGTLSNFDKFSMARANPESDWGRGAYFSNSTDDVNRHYTALDHPDMSSKYEWLKDQGMSPKEALKKLRVQHEGAIMPAYLRMENPFVVGGPNETHLDYDPLAKFSRRLDPRFEDAANALLEEGEGRGLSASKIKAMLRDTDGPHLYSEDSRGRMNVDDLVSRAIRRSGYDGIIDHTVSDKFPNLDEDTSHYIAFDPRQAKSPFNQDFDPTSPKFADGGKVSKIIKSVADKFGSYQASRMQRAADETNLERIHPEGLKRMFDPGQSGLYMSMPPGDFQDYAARIPQEAADQIPYSRARNVPGRKPPIGEQTQDWYIDGLARLMEQKGAYASPELHLTRTTNSLNPPQQWMTNVAEHEGRHRAMAMDRLGDPKMLVQLPNASMRSLEPEERVDYLTQKYFPRGKGELVVPEGFAETSSSGDPSLGPGIYQPRLPRPIYSEPYADGGKVLSLVERLAEGKPKVVKLPGGSTMPAYPIKEFEDVADKFSTRYGNKYPIDSYPKQDEDRARKIAQAYEDMKHDPSDPRVKRAYDALISETMDQYKALEGTGAKFEFLKPGEGDPYSASPSLGYKDLVENGRLKVFPTDQGYGTQTDISDNPLLKRVGRVGDLDNATANDAFRVVHDAMGHFGPGNPFFRAPGEERAWLNHMQSYSPDAVPAATSETRGQNSWVNFGPRAAENKGASGADTVYADQKAGLLPPWMYDQGEEPKFREGGDVTMKLAKRFLKSPVRESFPGIYKDPDKLVEEAKQRLVADPGKEGPMYKLFGHTRESLDDLSQGNRDLDSIKPFLQEHPFNLSGTAKTSPRVLTNPNASRLVNSLGEALSDPQMKLTRSWYEMSPLWDRMNELGTGDKAMRNLNNRMAVMSAGSDPKTEINRGFHANWLADQGRLEDFIKYGGVADDERGDWFPHDLADLKGHSYHGTAQVPNLLDYEETGRLWPANHKVPTYAAATDPKAPYSDRPIADSHFNRILGYPDVATAKTAAVRQGTPSNTEYSDIVPWFNDKVAGKLDMRPRDAQALLWNLGGPQTGVRYIGPSKLEMISDYMNDTATKLGVHPEEARDMLLQGQIGGAASHAAPFERGGRVADDLLAYQSQFFKKGGHVVPLRESDRDFDNEYQSQYFRRGGFFRR